MLGQILACPSCQGMVLIEPPDSEQLTIGRQHDIDSQAITSEAIREELESDGTFPSAGPSGIADSPADSSQDPSSPEDPGATAALPPGQWKPSGYQGYRQIGMIALVSLIAIVSSVAIFGLFIQSSLNKSNDKAGTEIADATPDPDSSSPDEPSRGPEVSPDPEASPTDAPVSNDTAPSPATPGSEPDSNPATLPSEPDAPESASPAENGLAEKTTKTDAPVAADATETPADTNKGAKDKEKTAAERIFAAPGAAAEQPDTPVMEELPESLQMFSSIFGQGLDLDQPDAKPQPSAMKPIRLEPLPELSGRYPTPADAVDAQQRLQQPLGLNLQATTLHAAVVTLSQLIAVPITFDLQSLAAAGIDLGTPVTGRYLNTTAGEAIREILASAGCTLQQLAPGQMVVRSSEPRITTSLAPAMSLADLEDPEQVVAMVTQLVHQPNDTAELTIAADASRLNVVGSSDAAWRVALALDAVRISRKLPPKLAASQTKGWLVDGRPEDLLPPNLGEIVLEGDLPRPVEHWLNQVAQANNARILIDWPNAWQYGLTPDHTLLPWSTHKSLGSLEQELLAPFGLTIRDLGEGNWLVTSKFALATSPQTVVFPQPIPAEAMLLERLAVAIGYESPEALPSVIDPVSKRLIARLPHFLQTQIAAELSTKL